MWSPPVPVRSKSAYALQLSFSRSITKLTDIVFSLAHLYIASHCKTPVLKEAAVDSSVCLVSTGYVPAATPMSDRRIILHVDVNNTVLIGDSAQSLGVRKSLSCHLAGIVWGRVSEGSSSWQWLKTGPSLCPPPGQDCTSYWKHLKKKMNVAGRSRQEFLDAVSTFAEKDHEGDCFLPLLEKAMDRLLISGSDVSAPLILEEDGQSFHRVLPSFFQLLAQLSGRQRSFRLFFRTFGADAGLVVDAVDAFSRGEHPLFPNETSVSASRLGALLNCCAQTVRLGSSYQMARF